MGFETHRNIKDLNVFHDGHDEILEGALPLEVLHDLNPDSQYQCERGLNLHKTSPIFMQPLTLANSHRHGINQTIPTVPVSTSPYADSSEIIRNDDVLGINQSALDSCSGQVIVNRDFSLGEDWVFGDHALAGPSMESQFPSIDSCTIPKVPHIETMAGRKSSWKTCSASTGSESSLFARGRDKSIAHQLSIVLESSQAGGFGNFDAAATAYYTTNLGENSTLDEVQNSSRSLHLEPFIHALHESSKDWAGRVSQGYRSAIFRSCKELYVEETRLFHANPDVVLQCRLSPFSFSTEPNAASSSIFNMRKRLFQENLPKLWSLLREVASASGVPEDDRPFLVTLVITLLCSGVHWRNSLKYGFSPQ